MEKKINRTVPLKLFYATSLLYLLFFYILLNKYIKLEVESVFANR